MRGKHKKEKALSLIENAAGRMPAPAGGKTVINVPELDERVRKSAERALNDPRLRSRLPPDMPPPASEPAARIPAQAAPAARLPQSVVALVSCCLGAGMTYLAMRSPTPPPVMPVEVPPVAVATPAPTPVVRDEDAIRALVQSWAVTWSQRDVEGYLRFYLTGFTPAAGVEPETWRRQRRERILGKRSIAVAADEVRVTLDSPRRARVQFRQSYAANGGRPQLDSKELVLQREDAGWRIVAEASAPRLSR